ncbi:MAG: response regulator transcription factor [Anaerolineales bacterium]|nr:response regulator transcription factor [Anaerolineales bacterium]
MHNVCPIRVIIVDDHRMVRTGLAAFLMAKPDLILVGEGKNGQEAIDLCGSVNPDIVLLDLKMPEMDGFQAARSISQFYPRIKIIALTSFADKEMIQQALQAGAVSYLLKNVSADDLADAIHSAYSGLSTLSPEAVNALAEPESQFNQLDREYSLTPRENEILALMVEGLNNPAIADRLSISRSTVKTHVSNILSKLGVPSRVEAVSKALQYNN